MTLTPKTKAPVMHRFGGAMLDFLANPEPEQFRPSGIKGLDALILGAVPGEMIVIGGDAGDGKTTLAVQWLLSTAQEGTGAGMFSLEMTRRAVEQRLIAGLTGVPLHVLRTKTWTEEQLGLVQQAAEFLHTLPLYSDDRSGLSADTIYDTLSYWKGQGIGLAVVDYLQNIQGTSENRVNDVGSSTAKIKAAAKDLDMPVILLSSLNRASGVRENKKPRKQDLRDSGAIEFVADTILMFYYPNGQEDKQEPSREAEIHVLKNRMGAAGIVPVWFHQAEARFEDRKAPPARKQAKKGAK